LRATEVVTLSFRKAVDLVAEQVVIAVIPSSSTTSRGSRAGVVESSCAVAIATWWTKGGMQSFETLCTVEMRMTRHHVEYVETTVPVLEDVEDIKGAMPALTLEEAEELELALAF
jgi:hypothetical protein